MTINYNKVDRFTPATNHSEFLGMKMHRMGEYVYYSDYNDLLKAYKELVNKLNVIVEDAEIEEW